MVMYFDFVLPRNTKQKSLNMVLNSNDRFHNKEKGKITRRIRNYAYWHTSISKDKKRKAITFRYGGLSNEKGHYKLIFEIEGVKK